LGRDLWPLCSARQVKSWGQLGPQRASDFFPFFFPFSSSTSTLTHTLLPTPPSTSKSWLGSRSHSRAASGLTIYLCNLSAASTTIASLLANPSCSPGKKPFPQVITIDRANQRSLRTRQTPQCTEPRVPFALVAEQSSFIRRSRTLCFASAANDKENHQQNNITSPWRRRSSPSGTSVKL
jgi:hypothetical protein